MATRKKKPRNRAPGKGAAVAGVSPAAGGLANIRNSIDAVDARIHALLNERARFAQLVGMSKSATGKAVDFYRPEREAEVLRLALKRGQVGGAALDVLPQEPFDEAHPLIADWLAREPWIEGRLALSPHAAFFSPASMVDSRVKAVKVALAYLREGRLTNCVNAALLAKA